MRMLLIRLIAAVPLLFAGSASGVSLSYDVQGSQSNLEVLPVTSGSATADLVGFDAIQKGYREVGQQIVSPSGELFVDTGLPGGFDGGANGIEIGTGSSVGFDASGGGLVLSSLFAGTPIQGTLPDDIAFLADYADATLTFDGPLDAALTPTAPNEYTFAGTAPVTLDFTLTASVHVPTQGTYGLPQPVPVSVPLPAAALAGTFQGDATGSEVVLGLDELTFQEDLAGQVDPISVPLEDPVTGTTLGSLDVTLDSAELTLNGSVVATNPTPIPEPATGLLVAAGVAGVAARRRALRAEARSDRIAG